MEKRFNKNYDYTYFKMRVIFLKQIRVLNEKADNFFKRYIVVFHSHVYIMYMYNKLGP